MNEELHSRISAAFQRVLSAPEGDRAQLLLELREQDPSVHQEVLSLMEFDSPEIAGGDLFSDERMKLGLTRLIGLVGEPGAAAESKPQPLPEFIGPYQVLEQIGEGGMGTVYLCQQEQPLRRRLAVKVIRRGMDTDEMVRRFEFERATIARMEHPGIARVLEAGATEDGLPYIAMEYAQGPSLLVYCDRERLTIVQRLRLFQQVLSALHHAHLRGVLHRDLKPSNILVCSIDGEPTCKIIDFGLARALDIEPDSGATLAGQLLGTPAYMSPEQSLTGHADLDVRADVYSAGVVLFELLTGSLPFTEDSHASQLAALRARAAGSTPAPKPSSRFGTSLKAASQSAKQRGGDIRRLQRSLKGDLDWVVLSAMDADRERRYDSAADFARDIEAFLRHEPVLAGPPNWSYRARKFVRRNRLALTAASAVLISLISALVVSLSATERSQVAEFETRELLGDVRIQNTILSRMITVADPRQLGPEAKVVDMLAEGVEFTLDDFGDHPRVVSQVLSSIGTNYREIGMWPEAVRCLSLAIEYQEQVPVRNREKEAFLCNGLGLVYSRLDDYKNAELYYQRAVNSKGTVDDPIDPRQQAAWESNLGTLLWKMHRNDEAEVVLLKSLKGHQEYFPDQFTGLAVISGRLGEIALERGDIEAGIAKLELSNEYALQAYDDPTHPHVNATVFSLGRALERHTERKQEGIALLEEALDTSRQIYGEGSHNLITYLGALVKIHLASGDFAQAEELIADELAIISESIEHTPTAAFVYVHQAQLLLHQKNPSEARPLLERAQRIYTKSQGPDHPGLLVIEKLLASLPD